MNFCFTRTSLNYNSMKTKHFKQLQNSHLFTLEKDSIQNILSSFRQGILLNKTNNSKFKTCKNSPDKYYIDKPKNMKSKINASKLNNDIHKINISSKIILTSKQKDINLENILKQKIIKLKEKKSITNNNSDNNNSISYNSHTNYTNMNNNTSSSLNNYLPQTQYVKKAKSKMTLDSSPQNSTYKKFQKRPESSLEDEEKNSLYTNSLKDSNYYPKNINLSSCSSKNYNGIKNPFNTIQNKSNNLILKNHLKKSSIFSSTLNYFKPKYQSKSPKYKLNLHIINKTSIPTQNNSRKNSNEKDILMNNNIYLKIKNNNNYFNNSPQLKNVEKKKDIVLENKFKHNKQKEFINANNKINYKNSIKRKVNNQKINEQLKNSDSGINKVKNQENKKLTLLESLVHLNLMTLKKKEGFNLHKNSSLQKIQNKKEENNKINEVEKNINLNKKVLEDFKSEISIKKENEKDSKKEKAKIGDRDLDNSKNLNDNLLYYLNLNLDQPSNNKNLNESNDSIQSMTNQKYLTYSKDKEIISSYIKQYFNINGLYPTTKMKFYKYGRLLGKGAFGKVNLSLHVLTGRLVAIKSINKNKLISERQKEKIKIETSIMKTLSSSDYIVKMFETYETEKHICIVMEYICAGDLLSYIRKRSKLTEPIAKYIFKQIILGIQHIHNNRIVHRDIKLDNILIDLDNKIKICDFGVSKRVNNNEKMFEQCGTPTYIAPEILKGKGYEGYKVDIWSAGVVLYAMLSGTVPFKGNNIHELHQLILKGDYIPLNDISQDAAHLIKSILEIEPKKRISIHQILSHPWLIDVNIDNNLNYNLFTNAERILLAKSNVDYRDPQNKEDMNENFDIRNLDTEEENENKNIKTKSLILAPFNTSMEEDESKSEVSIIDNNCNEISIENKIIKFSVKVKELNRIYELNNNGEIDNGIVISMDSNEKQFYNNISPSPYNLGSFFSKGNSKAISPINELEDNLSSKRELKENKKEIIEDALNEISKLGYLKPYVRECLNNNEKNYATASYFLLVKYCY